MTFAPELLAEVRDRFHHADSCPFQGPRAFFENAGGSLTLKSAVARTAELMAVPDNQGRTNVASQALMEIIAKGREDMKLLLGASSGEVFIGESGTELLGRLIRNAIFASDGAKVVGSHLEHPATYSACRRWSEIAGIEYEQVSFDTTTTVVGVDQYRPALTPDTAVATIIHASPVTGMHVDVKAIAAEIRSVAPECFIIVDGIQHAAHGRVDIDAYGIDGYVVSGYKLFSRHNFGVAWVSDRLATAPHDQLDGAPADVWELGTRDTSAYAAFSEVVRYLEWLGSEVGDGGHDRSPRTLIEDAAAAIHHQEQDLVDAMMWGTGGLPGLGQLDHVAVVGPETSEHRSGMISFSIDGIDSLVVVDELNVDGVRTHARKRDYYSAGVLEPLGIENCVRASVSHYNSRTEVERMLATVNRLAGS
jgi:selenocysteine lyase/cysteine desulfurase